MGTLLKKFIPQKLKDQLPSIFGFSAMAIGIKSIVGMDKISIVVISIIIGYIIGELLNLDGLLNNGVCKILNHRLFSAMTRENEEWDKMLALVIVLFCFSGTGIFGALTEGMTGDRGILIAKSALDFFTAIIFASNLGLVVSLTAFPQMMVFTLLYFLASTLQPFLIPPAIHNFIGCGGVITLVVGFNVAKIKEVSVMNLLPALPLVIILSQF